MTPFFIPFIFGSSGGSRRIGHITPTPKRQEDKPAEESGKAAQEAPDRETFDKFLRTLTGRLGWEYLDVVKFAFCYELETGEHIPETWYHHLKPTTK